MNLNDNSKSYSIILSYKEANALVPPTPCSRAGAKGQKGTGKRSFETLKRYMTRQLGRLEKVEQGERYMTGQLEGWRRWSKEALVELSSLEGLQKVGEGLALVEPKPKRQCRNLF